jgi:hypothetical protein
MSTVSSQVRRLFPEDDPDAADQNGQGSDTADD